MAITPLDAAAILIVLAAVPGYALARQLYVSGPVARAIADMLPPRAIRPLLDLGPLAPPILIWGSFRGGISIALALGLPDGLSRSVELTATYIVVLFAVIIQGGTIAQLIEWWRARYEVVAESDRPQASTG